MSDPENHRTAPAVTKGYGHSFTYYRWLPYKPQHRKQSNKLGRWQKMNEYAGFENCEAPGTLYPDPIPVAELVAENERLKETLRIRLEEVGALRGRVAGMKDALEAIERGDDSKDGMQGDIARAARLDPVTAVSATCGCCGLKPAVYHEEGECLECYTANNSGDM